MTLREKQSQFVFLVANLINYARAQGYELTFGEAWRSKEEAARLAALGAGIRNSLHMKRLAIDLNLFRDGTFLEDTEDHRTLGEWWEASHEGCRWGGNYTTRKDGNHYELVV